MARQAERAQVLEIALSTTFGDWKDMICVPQGAASVDRTESPDGKLFGTPTTAGSLQVFHRCDSIGGADGADTGIPGKYLVAQVPGVGTQTPLMHTEI
jgi:hypothetical protein